MNTHDGKRMQDSATTAADERIEALLRSTGRRPPVPEERGARVRSAVRAQWRAEVDRRARRRTRWTAAALAAAATIVIGVGLTVWQVPTVSPGNETVARVEKVVRSAWTRAGGETPSAERSALRAGDTVAAGAELITERRGRLAVRLQSGHSVRLDAGTRVRVLSENSLALDRGAIYVDSHGPALVAEGSLTVHTPYGQVRDVGTQFETRLLDTALRLRVREGAVILDGSTAPLEVTAGSELLVDAEGRTQRLDSSPFGPDWRWIDDVTPMMALEGRTAREFLEWIARERGLRLSFAGVDVEAAASRIMLNGSIDGMTLEQALASVLPTCRLNHRIDGDALVVDFSDSLGAPA